MGCHNIISTLDADCVEIASDDAVHANLFGNDRLGHPFALISGARSAENILLLQPLRTQREDNFDNAKHGHPFSLVSGARSAEKLLLLQPWRAQRKELLLQC